MTKAELLNKLHELQNEFSAIGGASDYVYQEIHCTIIGQEQHYNSELYEICDLCSQITDLYDEFAPLMDKAKKALKLNENDPLYM